MALKSLKRKRDDSGDDMAMEPSDSLYPWGTSLYLETETLDVLGLDELPAVGEEMLVVAKARVTGVNQRETEDGQNRNVDLQLTDMDVRQPEGPSIEDMAGRLYGGGDT